MRVDSEGGGGDGGRRECGTGGRMCGGEWLSGVVVDVWGRCSKVGEIESSGEWRGDASHPAEGWLVITTCVQRCDGGGGGGAGLGCSGRMLNARGG